MRKHQLFTLKIVSSIVFVLCTMVGPNAWISPASAAEFSTPTFGGSGGTRSYNLDCGARNVMVGLTFKSGSWIDAIGIICRKVNPSTGRLGEEFTRGPVGGVGGIARIRKCPSGAVLNDVRAFSGRFVNALKHVCYKWDPLRKRPNGVFRFPSGNTTFVFAGKACSFCAMSNKFTCPSGKVAKALRGRYGGYVDSTRFVCDAWDR